MKMNAIKCLEQARRQFSTQRKCEKHLQHLWECHSCKYHFSVTAGTIFHRSKIYLPRWFVVIWMMCHSPKGISAKQIEREIGVHYETAWYMAKQIRKAMKHDVLEDRLGGIIEVDDAVIRASGDGKPIGSAKFGGKNVLGVAERGGSLRMMILDGLKARDIKFIIANNLGQVQEIYSDAAKALFFLHQFGPLKSVAHMHHKYVMSEAHVNTIENAWWLLKRGLIGMYHHVNAKYLQEYLDEFTFQYSHRKEKVKLVDLVLANYAA